MLTPEVERALTFLADDGFPAKPTQRKCGKAVGQCHAWDHVHPSPWTQLDIFEWYRSEGYTKAEAEALVEQRKQEHAVR